MNPQKFDHANIVLRRPPGMENCGDLPVYADGQYCISCWKPSEAELASIAAGLPVWLTIVSRGQPPVELTTLSPFNRAPAPPERTAREAMQDIGKAVEYRLPAGTGFLVMTFPFGEKPGRLDYISNGQRADVINIIKEWLIKCGASEDWMKHID